MEKIIIEYPSQVNLQSASYPYIEIEPHTYQFLIDSISVGETGSINLLDYIGLDASVGDMLPLQISINADGVESNLINNTKSEIIEVVGAIDPNDIIVTPTGERVNQKWGSLQSQLE